MSEDRLLEQSVLAAISCEPSVTAGHIGVTASAGVVTLSGHVGSYAEKHAAETAARRVRGVQAVTEQIEVRLPFATQRCDEEIAAAAIGRLAWNVSVPKDSVQVMVQKGWVTLTGQVDWWFQKEAAQQDIRPLHGVVGISNLTTIRRRVDTATVGAEIGHALYRSRFFDPDDVDLRAEGGHVTLTGKLH